MAGEIFFDNGGSGEAIKSTLQPGSLAITLYDFNDDGSNSHVTMTPAEWDAFVAAGDRALGRKPARDFPPGVVRRARPSTDAEIVAWMADLYRDDTPIAEALERAALAMVREAGPTVPRAAVAAVIAEIDALECADEDAILGIRRSLAALVAPPVPATAAPSSVSPAHGQTYQGSGERFTLAYPERGQPGGRYWVTTDGSVVDMYVVSERNGFRLVSVAPATPKEG